MLRPETSHELTGMTAELKPYDMQHINATIWLGIRGERMPFDYFGCW